MKIRTQFAAMVVGITLIPVLLIGLGWTVLNLNRNDTFIPAYEQLPVESSRLINQAQWGKVRDMLANRPRHAETFVFDEGFRLIFSSRVVPGLTPGNSIDPTKGLLQLQKSTKAQDVVAFRPADTKVWIVLIFDNQEVKGDPFHDMALFAGIVLSAMLLFSILFSIVLGRNLTRSTVLLEKALARLAGGDLESTVDVRGSDEMRALGLSFDQLRVSLKEENARQSRFVMGVSHDLKSPMAIIKGYVELLKDGPASSPEVRETHFNLILDKVDQLDGMIDHLIDYGKVNTGEWQQTWTEVPLLAFLEEFLGEMAPDAQLLGRSLVPDLVLPGDLKVVCDRRSVRRCLENLVNNAMRYSEPGGTVVIGARSVPGAVEVTVGDNGPGIAPDDVPHVFELFYRGTNSRREAGMGLGLSIVKTIIDSHGWSIRVESVVGARFTITIPV